MENYLTLPQLALLDRPVFRFLGAPADELWQFIVKTGSLYTFARVDDSRIEQRLPRTKNPDTLKVQLVA